MIWKCDKCGKLVSAISEKRAMVLHKLGNADCQNVRSRKPTDHTRLKKRMKRSYADTLTLYIKERAHLNE